MRQLLEREGLQNQWVLDSAGTIGHHAGSAPDARMSRAAKRRGLEMRGEARQVIRADFDSFDLVLVMDRENYADLRALGLEARLWYKVRMFCEFCEHHDEDEVPDPYYGGEAGFEFVLDLLEDGCAGLLRRWKAGEFSGCT